jgi:lysophospholipase L1-like esterase
MDQTLRRKFMLWMALVLFVVIITEAFSALALSLLATNNPGKSLGNARRAVAAEIYARTQVAPREMKHEVDQLHQALVESNPYRWYGMPPNFQGEYFQTDRFGFRIDRSGVEPHTKKIAFYGGSTMFSVTTRAEHSIPAVVGQALDPAVAQTLNFGVGGYSSSAELALFLETARRESLTVAAFYDGVNEVGRYAESLQDDANAPYLDVFGYPFMDAYDAAARNKVVGGGVILRYRPYFLRLLSATGINLFPGAGESSKPGSIDRLITDANVGAHAERIVQQYLYNITDIAAVAKTHGIVPVFFWQPDIYTTAKTLTAYESDVRAEHPGMALLATAVRKRLQREDALANFHFFDLSDALDELGDDAQFFDYCHLSDQGNRHVGEAMIQILQRFVPSDYWRGS